jgi:hypothetical protein
MHLAINASVSYSILCGILMKFKAALKGYDFPEGFLEVH